MDSPCKDIKRVNPYAIEVFRGFYDKKATGSRQFGNNSAICKGTY
jgi:hypothetical protein